MCPLREAASRPTLRRETGHRAPCRAGRELLRASTGRTRGREALSEFHIRCSREGPKRSTALLAEPRVVRAEGALPVREASPLPNSNPLLPNEKPPGRHERG